MSYQQFSEVYKTWTDLELFELLQKKDDYQDDAVTAATAELNSRKLNETELAALHRTYAETQFEKQNTREKKLVRTLEMKKEKLIEDFNTLSETTGDRQIRLICYAIAIIILYSFISEYRWIRSLITYGRWDGSTVLSLMPYLFVPIGIYYFWKKQKFGWSIIAVWLFLSVINVIGSYLLELRTPIDPIWARFFPRLGLSHYLLSFLIFGGLLFYINTKKIVEPFNIDQKFQLQTGAIAAIFVFISLLISFF
jgi:hypothetical protein